MTPSHQSDDGRSALSLAAQFGTDLVVAVDNIVVCMSRKAFLGLMDICCLGAAGRSLCVDALLSAKVDVDTCDIYGDTPLHQASRNGSF